MEKGLFNRHKDFVSRNPELTRVPAGFKHIKSNKVNDSNASADTSVLETPKPKKKKKTSPTDGAKDEDTTDSD
jgi:hypothetical protein